MSKEIDIEGLLKRAPIGSDPRVKRAVLSRYAQRYGKARGSAGMNPFWRKPVPLYLATALVLVIAALSFLGGRRFPRPEHAAESRATAAQDSPAGAGYEQLWHFTQRDAL